jgi:predicted amidohydrolase YtcJ
LEQAAQEIELDDEFFRLNGVSVPRDGISSAGYMRMKRPYKGPFGEPTEGRNSITEERAERAMRFCAERGLHLVICAMGTRAHEENLAQLEELAKGQDIASLHWTLMHAFFLEAEQVRRYADLGFDVTTTMTVLSKGETYAERMGEDVLRDFLPLRRIIDAGMHVAGGSDWGPKSGFAQMELALTHRFLDSGRSNLGPAQRCSRDEAIAMWTTEAAKVMQWEGIGSLAVGSHGDLIVIDRDPFTCPLKELGVTQVLRTVLAGCMIYQAGVSAAV